jgi:hypothetical protein
LPQNLGGQALYLLPWIWVPLVGQLVAALRAGRRDERRWLLVCLATPPIAVFTLASLGGRPGLPHWPAPGYLFAVPLAGAWLGDLAARRGERVVAQRLTLAALALLLPIALIASQAATGWMNVVVPSLFRHGDPSVDLVDWTSATDQMAREGMLDGVAVVITRHWIDASKLGYALGGRVPVRCASDDPRHFRFLPSVSTAGDTLVVVRADSLGRPARGYVVGTSRARAAGVVSVTRSGRPILYLAAFRFSNTSRS